MPDLFILSAVRTPVGKFLGGLSSLPAPALGSAVTQEVLSRANVNPADVDEVIFGNVLQAGVGQAPARQAAILGGVPPSVPAFTVNKVCGSGLKAVTLAAQAIKAGDARLVLAGGMESMSNAPFLLPKVRQGYRYGDQTTVDSVIKDGLWCPFENWAMGSAAEYTAELQKISREDQDRLAVLSHQRADQAQQQGRFDQEIVPLEVNQGKKVVTVARDEGVRPESNLETLAKLKPAFSEQGTVTAGNASQLSDGAAAVVVADAATAEKLGTKPIAKIVSYAISGVLPKDIFFAPIPAVRMAIEKAGLSIGAIDLFELNEAFAAQVIACEQELGLDSERVNVNGGAIALGHPIGASGARVLVTLIYALAQRQARYGVAALCLGGGNAVAMVIERVE